MSILIKTNSIIHLRQKTNIVVLVRQIEVYAPLTSLHTHNIVEYCLFHYKSRGSQFTTCGSKQLEAYFMIAIMSTKLKYRCFQPLNFFFQKAPRKVLKLFNAVLVNAYVMDMDMSIREGGGCGEKYLKQKFGKIEKCSMFTKQSFTDGRCSNWWRNIINLGNEVVSNNGGDLKIWQL